MNRLPDSVCLSACFPTVMPAQCRAGHVAGAPSISGIESKSAVGAHMDGAFSNVMLIFSTAPYSLDRLV